MNFVQVFQSLNSPLLTITVPAWFLMLIVILAVVSLFFTGVQYLLKYLIHREEKRIAKWQQEFQQDFKNQLLVHLKNKSDPGHAADKFHAEAERATQAFVNHLRKK